MNTSHDFQKISEQNQVWPVGVTAFLCGQDTVSILNNIIIVILVHRDNKLKTHMGELTVNQAVADGSTSLLFVWFNIYGHYKPHSHITQTAVRVWLVALYSESFHTLAGSAFSLYMAICHSVKFRMYNQTWIVPVFIGVTWLLNISVGCLIFTTDNSIVHDDYMLFSFYRLQPSAVWYAVLKIVVMFLPPLLSFIWLIKIWIYKRALRNEEVQNQSASHRLISQAQGVLLFHVVYGLSFLVQIVNENVNPMTNDYETSHMSSVVISQIVYLYMVLKLPLFLLAFKPYRKVAKNMFFPCLSRNRVRPLPTDNSSDQHKNRTTTVTVVETTHATAFNRKMLHPKWSPSQKGDRADEERTEHRNTREEQSSVSTISSPDVNTTGDPTLHGGETELTVLKEDSTSLPE